jgi:hypothetical protein
MRQSQFDTLLIPIIYHHFQLGMNNIPSQRSRLFNVQDSFLAEEKGTGLGGFGVDTWDVYANTGGAEKGALDVNQLYTKTYTHREYPVQLTLEKKLLINDQYGQIKSIIRKTGMSAEQKMEKDAASILNNAFSSATANLGADGVALCSASHPVSPHEVSTVYTNTGTSALSASSVSTTRIAMMRFKDDKGNELGNMPNELWVPPELEDTALKIVKSLQEPSTANNDINPQNGRFSVIPWQRLTGTKAWFMVDSAWRKEVVNWYNRERHQIMLLDESTTHIRYEIKLHYSFGFDDWRFIYGHNPA